MVVILAGLGAAAESLGALGTVEMPLGEIKEEVRLWKMIYVGWTVWRRHAIFYWRMKLMGGCL
jgi:hypothetical protein